MSFANYVTVYCLLRRLAIWGVSNKQKLYALWSDIKESL